MVVTSYLQYHLATLESQVFVARHKNFAQVADMLMSSNYACLLSLMLALYGL